MSDILFLVAITGLGLSGLVSAIRLIEWFIHSDPKMIAWVGRWVAVGLTGLALPVLLFLLINQKWTAAIALAAVMLPAFALCGRRIWRIALATMWRRRFVDWSPPTTDNVASARPEPNTANPELVQRSIAVLEEYLRHTRGLPKHDGMNYRMLGAQHSNGCTLYTGDVQGGTCAPMSHAEALDVLGLGANATDWQINDAHRRLVQLVHPDRGGSHYLTVKINQARELLLGPVDAMTESTPPAAAPPRKSGSRRPRRVQQH